MSIAEIEAELERLQPDELRRLALKSWAAYLEQEEALGATFQCDEEDSQLLAALDEAVACADAARGKGCSGTELHTHLGRWTTR